MTAIEKCNNVNEFRKLAKKKLPYPIFHYIDGAADDEITYRRNTESFEKCYLVPSVLRPVKDVDLGIKILGRKIDQIQSGQIYLVNRANGKTEKNISFK